MVPANRGVDVIEFAIRDLEYAAVNLSKTASDVGRVTCYSAYAILSRMYLSMAGLTTEGEYNGSNIATDFNRGSRNTYYLDMALQSCHEGDRRRPVFTSRQLWRPLRTKHMQQQQ